MKRFFKAFVDNSNTSTRTSIESRLKNLSYTDISRAFGLIILERSQRYILQPSSEKQQKFSNSSWWCPHGRLVHASNTETSTRPAALLCSNISASDKIFSPLWFNYADLYPDVDRWSDSVFELGAKGLGKGYFNLIWLDFVVDKLRP